MHRKAPTPPNIHGFSLVEVTLAIGIIAFAFVALFGLLPAGLQVFRSSMDAANEAWIMQSLNSMVQVTEWSKVVTELGQPNGDIFYFDEEGRLTDTDKKPATQQAILDRRLYAVKLIIDDATEPNSTEKLRSARRVIAVLANYTNPRAMIEFKGVNSATALKSLPKDTQLRTRAFLATQMDAEA